MGRTCKGICEYLKAKPLPNNERYKAGHKRCSFCGMYFLLDGVRCPCCQATLRTKPRSKKAKKVLNDGLH